MHARISFGHGEDPGEYVAAALRDLKAIITINPKISGTYIEKAQLNRLQAESKTSQGLPARRFLDKAENASNRALEINASEAATFVEKSRILLLRAMWSDGQEKKNFLQLGINAAKKALEINPGYAEAHMMCGAHELRLALETDDSSKKSTLATSALVAFNRGIELDPLFDREFAEDLAEIRRLNASQ